MAHLIFVRINRIISHQRHSKHKIKVFNNPSIECQDVIMTTDDVGVEVIHGGSLRNKLRITWVGAGVNPLVPLNQMALVPLLTHRASLMVLALLTCSLLRPAAIAAVRRAGRPVSDWVAVSTLRAAWSSRCWVMILGDSVGRGVSPMNIVWHPPDPPGSPSVQPSELSQCSLSLKNHLRCRRPFAF